MNTTEVDRSASLFSLTDKEFNQLAELVYKHCGINLSQGKKIMLEARLNKRLRALGIATFKDYIHLVTSRDGIAKEFTNMIDVVTTNKTDFFREPHHFDFLREHILTELVREGRKELNVWSAACSTGEEPYTLAMVLQDFSDEIRGFNYSILASDISTTVLQKASLAVYSIDRIVDVPIAMKKKYLLRSKSKDVPTVRIAPALRNKIRFKMINFMESALPVQEQFDVVFCRNVLIYFDRKTQFDVIKKITDKLKPGGYLFIGHSESLYQLDLPLEQVKPTIYKKI